MFPSIVDLSGLNRISRLLLSRAAGAICGMVAQRPAPEPSDRPVIVASMFGNTTACVTAARAILEAGGLRGPRLPRNRRRRKDHGGADRIRHGVGGPRRDDDGMGR